MCVLRVTVLVRVLRVTVFACGSVAPHIHWHMVSPAAVCALGIVLPDVHVAW